MAGNTVVDPGTVLLTHLEETLKSHASEILSLQDVHTMLDHLRRHSPALVEEIVPKLLSVSDLHRVLAGLLRERVPVRDLPRLLTALATHAPAAKDPDALTEVARQALARTITAQYQEDDGALWVCTLDPAAEADLLARARGEEAALSADWTEALLRSLTGLLDRLVALGHSPVVLCGPTARPLVRALLERRAPTAAVLSHHEIAPGVRVRSAGLASPETAAASHSHQGEAS